RSRYSRRGKPRASAPVGAAFPNRLERFRGGAPAPIRAPQGTLRRVPPFSRPPRDRPRRRTRTADVATRSTLRRDRRGRTALGPDAERRLRSAAPRRPESAFPLGRAREG